jgi:hypothetical protein
MYKNNFEIIMKKNIVFTAILGVSLLFSVPNAIAADPEGDDWLHTDTWPQESSPGLRGAIGEGEKEDGDVSVPVGQAPEMMLLLLAGAYLIFKKRKQVRIRLSSALRATHHS